MKTLVIEKQRAIDLRTKGYTYSEIRRQVIVSQSTLSLWLRQIPLSPTMKKRIEQKKLEGVITGAQKRRETYLQTLNQTLLESKNEINQISDHELLLIGTALYWAEGTKQNRKQISQGVKFSNSDPDMIAVFILWLTRILGINNANIIFELYIHQSMISQKSNIINYWAQALQQPTSKFDRIYLKHNPILKSYPKQGYRGVVRVVVKKSANLNRKISGWQQGIVNSCRVV